MSISDSDNQLDAANEAFEEGFGENFCAAAESHIYQSSC